VNNAHAKLWAIEAYFDGIPGRLCIPRTTNDKAAADINACVRWVWASVSLVVEPPGSHAPRNERRTLPGIVSAGHSRVASTRDGDVGRTSDRTSYIDCP